MKVIQVPTEYNNDIRVEIYQEPDGVRLNVEGIVTPLIHPSDAEELVTTLARAIGQDLSWIQPSVSVIGSQCVGAADFKRLLRAKLRELGSQKALAGHMGISPQYLNDILRGRRSPSDRVLARFGLRWAIVKRA